MDSLAPILFVKDVRATVEFYKLLGFRVVISVPAPEGNDLAWAMATCGNVTFIFDTFQSLDAMFLDELLPQVDRQGGGSLSFYIRMTDIRNFFDRVKDQVTVARSLERTFYGATEFSILDNNNFLLTFSEDEGEV